jgi:hypothetical protein
LLVLGPLAALGTGAALIATSGASPEPSNGDRDTIVIVCESGVESVNGVETSSANATRVPAGTPIPKGCRVE